MSKITKKQNELLEKLIKEKSDAMDEVFDFASGGHMRFDECLNLATPEARDKFIQARDRLFEYQDKLVSEHRGYWIHGEYPRFQPYYN